jgi:hypothetical protein
MNPSHCPICFTALETRQTTGCFVCGAWEDTIAHPTERQKDIHRYALPNDQELDLCSACFVEEFMVPGGLSSLLEFPKGDRLARELRYLSPVSDEGKAQDKFCRACNLRLAYLRLVVTCREANRPHQHSDQSGFSDETDRGQG